MIFFDPEKAAGNIAMIFDEMGWTWAHGTPTAPEIAGSFRRMMSELAIDTRIYSLDQGRIRAERMRDAPCCIVYGLSPCSYDEWMFHREMAGV